MSRGHGISPFMIGFDRAERRDPGVQGVVPIQGMMYEYIEEFCVFHTYDAALFSLGMTCVGSMHP